MSEENQEPQPRSEDETRIARAIDVLVVGAGPTGVTLAGELAARGVRHRIVDAKPEASDTSRALSVQARTLEVLRMMGYADKLLEHGTPLTHMTAWMGEKKVIDLDLGHATLDGSPYQTTLFVSQAHTERVLRERLADVGGHIEWGVGLEDFAVGERGVVARLRHRDGHIETVRARYIVGCDGAHSVVRETAGIPFEGESYSHTYIQADVSLAGDWRRDRPQVWLTDRGPFGIMPLDTDGTFRLVTNEFDVPDDPPPVTIDDFLERAEAAGIEIEPTDVTWVSRFHVHHRGVETYRKGPVFLAGDAAHIHSPAGGQGMNTGIQDAFNLGWKLDAVLRGAADEALLDSYHAERWPVGDQVLRFTDRWFRLTTSQSGWAKWLRKLVMPIVSPMLTGDVARNSWLFRFMSEIDIRYHGMAGEAKGEGAIDGGAKPGLRAPDARIRDPEGQEQHLFDVFSGAEWKLLCFMGPEAAGDAAVPGLDAMRGWAGDRGIACRVIAGAPGGGAWVDVEGDAHAHYGLEGPGTYLVRPDGHILWRGAGFDVQGMQRWLAETPLHFERADRAAA